MTIFTKKKSVAMATGVFADPALHRTKAIASQKFLQTIKRETLLLADQPSGDSKIESRDIIIGTPCAENVSMVLKLGSSNREFGYILKGL
jgi:hypothetical protein